MGLKVISLIITHIGTLPNTSTHSPRCPPPGCPNNILLGPEEPMLPSQEGCPGQAQREGCSLRAQRALVLLPGLEGLYCPGAQG